VKWNIKSTEEDRLAFDELETLNYQQGRSLPHGVNTTSRKTNKSMGGKREIKTSQEETWL